MVSVDLDMAGDQDLKLIAAVGLAWTMVEDKQTAELVAVREQCRPYPLGVVGLPCEIMCGNRHDARSRLIRKHNDLRLHSMLHKIVHGP